MTKRTRNRNTNNRTTSNTSKPVEQNSTQNNTAVTTDESAKSAKPVEAKTEPVKEEATTKKTQTEQTTIEEPVSQEPSQEPPQVQDEAGEDKEQAIKSETKSTPEVVAEKQAREDGKRKPLDQKRPPMNPFMRQEAERKAKIKTNKVATPTEMDELISDLGIKVEGNFMFKALISHLNDYVTVMAPNTPIDVNTGARMQKQLAGDIFASLEASPQESAAALKIIELYFTKYKAHALGRRYIFRFMDSLKLDHQKALAFQSLLHLFAELGNKGDRTRKEIARQVSIRKIADYMPNNTDAQIRLAEFMS